MIKQLTERLIRKSVNIPLGRWGIHDNIQTALKIKYANEDNCGTCDIPEHRNNINKNMNVTVNLTVKEDLDDLYIYMMGLETVPDCKPK